jgi:hypothetical protein
MITVAVPVVLAIFIGGYRRSAHEIHHGLLAATAGRFVALHKETLNRIVIPIYSALCRLITEALKNRIGKF